MLLAVIGLGASIATVCLMRFTDNRRDPFRQYGASSVTASLFGAAGLLALCVLMVLAQGA